MFDFMDILVYFYIINYFGRVLDCHFMSNIKLCPEAKPVKSLWSESWGSLNTSIFA